MAKKGPCEERQKGDVKEQPKDPRCPRCPAKFMSIIGSGVKYLQGHTRFVCGTRVSPDGNDIHEGQDCLRWQLHVLLKLHPKWQVGLDEARTDAIARSELAGKKRSDAHDDSDEQPLTEVEDES